MNTAPVPINRGTERRRSSTTIRRISFCKVDTVGNKRSLDLLTGLPQDGPKVSIPEAAWNPKEATSKNLNRSSSKNLIDGRLKNKFDFHPTNFVFSTDTKDLDLKSHSKDWLVRLVGQPGNRTHNVEITSPLTDWIMRATPLLLLVIIVVDSIIVWRIY
jgi:hypothetical protein